MATFMKRASIPLGTFAMALALAAACPSLKTLYALRQAGDCTGITIPQVWENTGLVSVQFGTQKANRNGNTIKLKFERLETAVDTARTVHKKCKSGTKEVCVEVFNADGPVGGVVTSAEVPRLKEEARKEGKLQEDKTKAPYPIGSHFCAHWISFVLTPCDGGVLHQIVQRTVTANGKPQPQDTDKDFTLDDYPGTGVAGPGFFSSDAPGTVFPKDYILKEGKLTVVKIRDFKTFFDCDSGPVAVVVWQTTTTWTVGPLTTDLTCSTSFKTPEIFCASGGSAAETKTYTDAKAILDKLLKPKKD